jgi:hypothetical protein
VKAPSLDPAVVKVGGGCEGALQEYVRRCMETPADCSDKSKTDGVMGAYGAVLNNPGYLDDCKSPPSTGVKVCAAVMKGHAVGVTVTTSPGDEGVATCIAQKVQGLPFPVYPRLDVTNTSFAAQ